MRASARVRACVRSANLDDLREQLRERQSTLLPPLEGDLPAVGPRYSELLWRCVAFDPRARPSIEDVAAAVRAL